MADQHNYRGKRVDNGKWAVGWYFVLNGKPYIYRNLSYPNKDVLRNSCEVHPESVSDSTGRKDKHGHEIYGGMKLRSDTKRELVVRWSDMKCAFVADDGDHETFLAHWNTESFAIIPEGE